MNIQYNTNFKMTEVKLNDSLLCHGRCYYLKWSAESTTSSKVVISFMERTLFLRRLLKFNEPMIVLL